MYENIMIVIPSLNPDEKLCKTVDELRTAGFSNFLIVNDGSDEQHLPFFPREDEVLLLHHRRNRGKGSALKSAFRHIQKHMPEIEGVVTVDSDGQHKAADVAKCVEALDVTKEATVLGCRDFSGSDVPKRSRFGNRTTSLVFRLLCGMKISDTQTGLRAFSSKLLPLLCSIEGDRFEYETNMLLKFKSNRVEINEVKIETVYIEENRSSHFHAVKDSLRVYRFILAFVFSSAISFIADISLFYALAKIFGGVLGGAAEVVATVGARAVSSLLNFSINKKTVFSSKAPLFKTLVRYYILAIVQMGVSAAVVTLLSNLVGAEAEGATAIKIVVDTILFLISYRIQQNWVFADKQGKKEVEEEKPKTKLKPRKIVGRFFITVGTSILLIVVLVVSTCFVICYGPSPTLRDMLVISAKQASATKWIPELFLSSDTVDEIMENSKKINADTIDSSKFEVDTDEWDNAIDGMQFINIRKPRFKAYMLLIKDPARVKVGVSSGDFKNSVAGKRIFEIAEKYNAVAAINAGEFADTGGRGNGARPMGLTYSGGKVVWSDGLSRTFMGFDKNNKLICKNSMTEKEAEALGIRDAVSFQNGNLLIDHDGEKVNLYYGDKNTGTAQRTAIAQRADGTVILLVTDGRSADSIGATRNDVIDILIDYGAVTAGMLDGGSSAMMYYRDYYKKYPTETAEFDEYQKQGLVNRYKAFTTPRRMPTFFIVTGE
jgi:exopolysaccharide biosynthesis protein/glycosyltransferase involved in cell wall biosynthesis